MNEDEKRSADIVAVSHFMVSNIRKHVRALLEENYETCAQLVEEKEIVLSFYAERSSIFTGISVEESEQELIQTYRELFSEEYYLETGQYYPEN